MRILKKAWQSVVAVVATATAAAAAVVSQASAQTFESVESTGLSNLIGSDTSGSETGIYEIVSAQVLLAGAIVGMVVISAGFMLFRRWLRRATG